MKKIISFLFTTGFVCLHAQSSVRIRIAESVEINNSIPIEVKIHKGPGNKFSKYELDCPEDLVIKESESLGGSFSYSAGLTKIIWPVTPENEDILIKMELSAGSTSGVKNIRQKYYYMEGDEKKEVTALPVILYVTDSLNGVSVIGLQKTEAKEKPLLNAQNPAEMKDRVAQLRKDSKEAYESGEKEKLASRKKMEEAETALKDAGEIKNEERRNKALAAAREEKEKAQMGLETADKILDLAKSLEENANEIEKLSGSMEELEQKPLRDSTASTDSSSLKYKKPADPAELKKQIARMKKDAKEAKIVGEQEKKKALFKITGAENIRKKSLNLKDEQERARATEVAQQMKEEAENELEVANKILLLAENLTRDAAELEKQLKNDLQTAEKNKTPEKLTENTDNQKSVNAIGETGSKVKFYLQIGAYRNKPEKKLFKTCGKVQIIEEEGLFKVLIGSFKTRDEALKKKEEIARKGFDSFIVTRGD